MSKARKVPIEEIEEKAVRGEDVSAYFEGEPKRMPPEKGPLVRVSEEKGKDVQRVNVDFSTPMLRELDQLSKEFNVPRQSMIKMMVRAAMDRHYSAKKAKS